MKLKAIKTFCKRCANPLADAVLCWEGEEKEIWGYQCKLCGFNELLNLEKFGENKLNF